MLQAILRTVKPTTTNAEYKQGFAEVAKLYPRVVGEPMDNEGSPVEGISHQLTTNGVLTWTIMQDGREVITFVRYDGTRYGWTAN